MNGSILKKDPFRSVRGFIFDTGNTAISNAQAGYSYHNYGLAFDVVEIKSSSPIWAPLSTEVGTYGESFGFEWGGRFSTIYDPAHFQLTNGLSIVDLLFRHYGF